MVIFGPLLNPLSANKRKCLTYLLKYTCNLATTRLEENSADPDQTAPSGSYIRDFRVNILMCRLTGSVEIDGYTVMLHSQDT